MRWLVVVALLGMGGPAHANQKWIEIVEGIARLPLPERAGEAVRQAEAFVGPPPTDTRLRQRYAGSVESQRQLMLAGVASIERRAVADLDRRLAAEDAAHARLRAIEACRVMVPGGRDDWAAIHTCYANMKP